MANAVLTPTMITNKSAIMLQNLTTFSNYVDRQYSDQFAKDGAKIGAVLNVRKPPRFQGRLGPTLSVEDQTETYVPLVITTQFGVDVQFSSQELTLSMQDFSQRVLQPNMATVANKIDRDGLLQYLNVPNLVGTPGTTPATLNSVLGIRTRLLDMGFPDDGQIYACLGTAANQGLVAGNSALFNPQDRLSKQYESGIMANIGGIKVAVDQNVGVQTVGPLGGSPTVNGANQGQNTGWSYSQNLVTNGWTAAAAKRLSAGDVFTLASVFSVNPQSRASTGVLQQFVCQADVFSDSSGNATIPMIPAIIYGGQFQNVTISPANAAVITPVGTASTAYPQNLGFHKSAFTLAMVDLVLPEGVDFARRATYDSFSIRLVRAFDINNDRFPVRSDVLYGYKTIYPEGGVRLTG